MKDPLDRILDVASRFSKRVAIETSHAKWNYEDLERRLRAYAKVFSSKDSPCIAVVLPQENEAYAAILGAGLAGGYHSPINTQAPVEKIRQILERLAPNFVVARPPLVQELCKSAPTATFVDPDQLDGDAGFVGRGWRHSWAYINFTSGSTGIPKGVVVSRNALANYVAWLDCFEITPDDRVSQQPNLAFDISLTDIYGALCHGATLVPVLDEQDKMMPGHFVRNNCITIWNSTPSAISQMMRARQLDNEKFGTVRLVNFCGEALFPEQVEAVFAAVPDAVVHNTYGPTEATVAVTCERLSADSFVPGGRASIALGDMLPDMNIELFDGPSQNEGEAVIFGPQLAEGYFNDPAKTSEAFQDFGGRRGYRTGDWMVRAEGKLYFKERIDFQAKVRGFRIELDEVAWAIRKTGWTVAVVFKHGDGLAAVVESQPDREFNARLLKKELETFIERHAIPAKIICVERIPRNANDKLDRKAAQLLFEDSLKT